MKECVYEVQRSWKASERVLGEEGRLRGITIILILILLRQVSAGLLLGRQLLLHRLLPQLFQLLNRSSLLLLLLHLLLQLLELLHRCLRRRRGWRRRGRRRRGQRRVERLALS